MTYLLDTNACIAYLNRIDTRFLARMQAVSPDDIYLCDIVKFELYYGAYNSSRPQDNLATLRRFFTEFRSLPFNEAAAERAGYWRLALKRAGNSIGAYDLQIAAIALANNLTLVTHNRREFERIDRLNLDDWEA